MLICFIKNANDLYLHLTAQFLNFFLESFNIWRVFLMIVYN